MSEKYFIYCPYEGVEFYTNKEEFEKAVADCDFRDTYLIDGWNEEVLNVTAGVIPEGVEYNEDDYDDDAEFFDEYATYKVEQYDVEHKPDDLDEDDYSPSQGEAWDYGSEFDYVCKYRFTPMAQPNSEA